MIFTFFKIKALEFNFLNKVGPPEVFISMIFTKAEMFKNVPFSRSSRPVIPSSLSMIIKIIKEFIILTLALID